jgi:hypothetical protein
LGLNVFYKKVKSNFQDDRAHGRLFRTEILYCTHRAGTLEKRQTLFLMRIKKETDFSLSLMRI